MKSAGSPTPNKKSSNAKDEEIGVGIHMSGGNVAMVSVSGTTFAIKSWLNGQEPVTIDDVIVYVALKMDYWFTRENWNRTAQGAINMATANEYTDHAVALPNFIATNTTEAKGILCTFPPQEVWDEDAPHLMDEWNKRALAFKDQLEKYSTTIPSSVSWISGHRVTTTVHQVNEDVFASCMWMRMYLVDKKGLPPSATERELAAEQEDASAPAFNPSSSSGVSGGRPSSSSGGRPSSSSSGH